ncbi:MAG: hypothetical protein AB7C97_03925 [Oscillospiraceae bacterium]
MENKKIKVGIGFVTGREPFQDVLRSYIYTFKESGLVESEHVSLNLFVAYDLNYRNTKKTDYTPIDDDISEMLDSQHFIGKDEIEKAKRHLASRGIADEEEASMIFGAGYASLRNVVLYSAVAEGMDCLLFLDDDEYPVAVTNTRNTAVWGGQEVLKTHLHNIRGADITYGHHCGYISPIPYIPFTDVLSEDIFRRFIGAISNDIVSWDSLKRTITNGGVTYADTGILTSNVGYEVPETNHTKFISGSNLCINTTDPGRVFPFYNPPGARGEDTFLSTCLSERKVMRVPCYTFHDGFSTYNHLLLGVLPIKLRFIQADSEQITTRFYKACVGWIRYKPLLVYITDRDRYADTISGMKANLEKTLPAICKYFGTEAFYGILDELEEYDANVKKHYDDFIQNKIIWARIMGSVEKQN